MQHLAFCCLTPFDRIDVGLKVVFPQHSRSFFQDLIRKDFVRINGDLCDIDKSVRSRDEISVTFPDVKSIGLVRSDIPLTIIYEDDDVLVIDKPAGMVVHPSDNGGHLDDTLVNAVMGRSGYQRTAISYRQKSPLAPLSKGGVPKNASPGKLSYLSSEALVEEEGVQTLETKSGQQAVSERQGPPLHTLYPIPDTLYPIPTPGSSLRPGIVHRLDKDTSGLIVVAKHDQALSYLAKQWEERSVNKEYLALVVGIFSEGRGVIEAPIGRSTGNRQKMAVRSGSAGKEARTEFQTVQRYNVIPLDDSWHLADTSPSPNHSSHPTDASTRLLPYRGGGTPVTLVKIRILTGRTHQIRVHFASIGHPVVGDQTYGNVKVNRAFREQFGLTRQFLHAHKLSFTMPSTGEEREFTSALPEELERVVAQCTHLLDEGGLLIAG